MLPRPTSIFDAPAPTGAVYRFPDTFQNQLSAVRIGGDLYMPDEPLTRIVHARYNDILDRLLQEERRAWQERRRLDSNWSAFDRVNRWLRAEPSRTNLREGPYVITFTIIYNNNQRDNPQAQNTVGIVIKAKHDNEARDRPVTFVALTSSFARAVELPLRTSTPPPPTPSPAPAVPAPARPEAAFLTDRYNAAMNRGAFVYDPPPES